MKEMLPSLDNEQLKKLKDPKHIAELSIGDIDNFKVESYTSQVTPLFAKIGANVRENKELQQLRDWLLPMLMNGQATIED